MNPEEQVSVELAQLRQAEEVGHFGSYAWNLDTQEFFWTPGMYALLRIEVGTEPPTMETYMRRVPQEERVANEAQAREAIAANKPYMREYRMSVGQPRREIWVRVKGTPMILGGQRHVVGVVMDITEQMHARQEVQELNRILLGTVQQQQAAIELLDAARAFPVKSTTFQEHQSARCPRCAMVSWNATDIAHGYCGNCHDWTMVPRRVGNAPTPDERPIHERDNSRGHLP